MTQNKLSDLNNHLFAQLERLGDEELFGEALEEEIKRAEAIAKISEQVIDNASLVSKIYLNLCENHVVNPNKKIPKILGFGDMFDE